MTGGARLNSLVLVWTGSESSGDALVQALKLEGADVERRPLVEFGPPPDPSGVEKALKRVDEYSWVLFTSAQAVGSVRGRNPPEKARVAAVGPATAALLNEIGWRVDLVPSRHDSNALADELEKTADAAKPLLFLCGDKAGDTLRDRLAKARLSVEEVLAYSSRPVDAARAKAVVDRIFEAADAVVIGSPLGAETLAKAAAPKPLSLIKPNLKWICLGRSTKSALEKAGVKNPIHPDKVEPLSLVEAVVAALGRSV